MRPQQTMRRHDQIDKAVVINVTPYRVPPGVLCLYYQTDFSRDIVELLGHRCRRENRREPSRRRQA